MIREIKEETGLTILNPILCGVKNWVNDDGSRKVSNSILTLKSQLHCYEEQQGWMLERVKL